MKQVKENKPIILFDGICNLCNGLVSIIIKRDKNKIFSFETLQSEDGQKILIEHDLNQRDMDTIVLIVASELYIKSQAIFRIIRLLGGLWKIFLIFQLFPDKFNDYIYDILSRNRYGIFGRRDHCIIIDDTFQKK